MSFNRRVPGTIADVVTGRSNRRIPPTMSLNSLIMKDIEKSPIASTIRGNT
jgi:hypothetical protein